MADWMCKLLTGQDNLSMPLGSCPPKFMGHQIHVEKTKIKMACRILGDFIDLLVHAIASPNPTGISNPYLSCFTLCHLFHCSPIFTHAGLLCSCLECTKSQQTIVTKSTNSGARSLECKSFLCRLLVTY